MDEPVRMSVSQEPIVEPPHADVSRQARVRSMFEQHYDFVWRSLRRLGLSAAAADDASQEVFLVAMRKIDLIEAGTERSFLFGSALRIASDVRRAATRRGSSGPEPLEQLADGSPQPDDLVDRARARMRLDLVLEAMSFDLRTVFVLFELEEMTMADIASLLDVPPGTVASRLRRAREVFHEAAEGLSREAQP